MKKATEINEKKDVVDVIDLFNEVKKKMELLDRNSNIPVISNNCHGSIQFDQLELLDELLLFTGEK